jgi:hypothetical protein
VYNGRFGIKPLYMSCEDKNIIQLEHALNYDPAEFDQLFVNQMDLNRKFEDIQSYFGAINCLDNIEMHLFDAACLEGRSRSGHLKCRLHMDEHTVFRPEVGRSTKNAATVIMDGTLYDAMIVHQKSKIHFTQIYYQHCELYQLIKTMLEFSEKPEYLSKLNSRGLTFNREQIIQGDFSGLGIEFYILEVPLDKYTSWYK